MTHDEKFEELAKKIARKTDDECYSWAIADEMFAILAESEEPNILKIVTSEWQHDIEPGKVDCHSRMIGGVLFRWWGKQIPPGVARIDKAAEPEEPRGDGQVPIAWLGAVDQGMGHWHFEIAEPNAKNAFPVYRHSMNALTRSPEEKVLREALINIFEMGNQLEMDPISAICQASRIAEKALATLGKE